MLAMNPETVKAAFQKMAAKKIDDITNVLWPWTVPTGFSDLAKMVAMAIKLGGFDPQTVKEFTEEEVTHLGGTLEGLRRLEMRAETREILLQALAEHGILIEFPPSVVPVK